MCYLNPQPGLILRIELMLLVTDYYAAVVTQLKPI